MAIHGKKVKNEEIQSDLVVVGGGGAGIAAAVAAAEGGVKDIVVLEAQEVAGGNSVYAISMATLEKTPGSDDTYLDGLFKTVMKYAHWQNNARVTRALIDKATEVMPWLEKNGFKGEKPALSPSGQPSPFFLGTPGGERFGARVSQALVRKCTELGIRILYRTRGRKLIREGGKVTGVLAEGHGKEIKINAGSVIIATGGFIGNKELLKKYHPPFEDDDNVYIGGTPQKGDGLSMATEIGAATDARVSIEMSANRTPWSACMFLIAKHPKTLWVNKKGERFTDESDEWYYSQYRQPGKTVYTILDEKIKESIYREALFPIDQFVLASNMALDVTDAEIIETLHKEGLFVGDNPWPPIAEKDFRWQESKGRIKKADSLDEIARWIGVKPEVLKATVDEYNRLCDEKHDRIFAKDVKHLLPLRQPPYYAIRGCQFVLTTQGGIKVNHHMEVLDTNDDPILGLYAAGAEATGADFDTYCPIGGHGLGFAVNSGIIAGENAAEYVNSR